MSGEEHKHGLMDKLFHHKEKHEGSAEANTQQDAGSSAQQAQPEQHQHKETEKEKFENYMEKDEEMVAEGKEYGGLM